MTLQGELAAQDELVCPGCGFQRAPSAATLPPVALYHPWHVRDRASVEAYVATLAEASFEWLLALYVDEALNLLSVHAVGKGDVGGCEINLGRIYLFGKAVGAAAYLLVHNHPSGDPTPSPTDVRATMRLARLSAELDMPLLDHFIVASGGVRLINVHG